MVENWLGKFTLTHPIGLGSFCQVFVGRMSYGAPCEQGVSTADTMPQQDLEVPGLVPAVDGVGLAMKEAQCQRGNMVSSQGIILDTSSVKWALELQKDW